MSFLLCKGKNDELCRYHHSDLFLKVRNGRVEREMTSLDPLNKVNVLKDAEHFYRDNCIYNAFLRICATPGRFENCTLRICATPGRLEDCTSVTMICNGVKVACAYGNLIQVKYLMDYISKDTNLSYQFLRCFEILIDIAIYNEEFMILKQLIEFTGKTSVFIELSASCNLVLREVSKALRKCDLSMENKTILQSILIKLLLVDRVRKVLKDEFLSIDFPGIYSSAYKDFVGAYLEYIPSIITGIQCFLDKLPREIVVKMVMDNYYFTLQEAMQVVELFSKADIGGEERNTTFREDVVLFLKSIESMHTASAS